MPANLTPDYHEAEEKYKAARTAEEKIAALEEMLAKIPKHKGTDHLQADLKRRLSQTKKEAAAGKKGGPARSAANLYYVKPEGIGQAFLVGPPNSGKSALLKAVTNALPEVADYPFTTVTFLPGMMRYEDVWIQLVDLPPVSRQAPVPWLPSMVRYGDTALFVLSLGSDDVLAEAEEVSGLLQEGKVVLAREGEPCGQLDSGIAALRTILVATHCLDPHADDRLDLLLELLGPGYPVVRIDQAAAETLIPFRKAVYDSFALLRVYTKQPGKPADRNAPFVLRQGSTLEDLAGKIHKDIRAGLQYARVWKLADNAIDGLRVPRDYRLEEGDVVEIHA